MSDKMENQTKNVEELPKTPKTRQTKKPTKKDKERELENSKATIKELLKGNINFPIDELMKRFPDINPRVITGIKGYLKNPATKALTESKVSIPSVLAEGNAMTKQAFAEAVTQYFAGLGLSPDSVKRLAEEINSGKILGKTAPFTPQTDPANPNSAKDQVKNTESAVVSTPKESIQTSTTVSNDVPVTQQDLMSFINEMRQMKGIKGRPDDNEGIQTETLMIDEGSAVPRAVYLTPKTLIYFDISRENKYPGDLSSFLNDCVTKWFENRNMKIGFINLQEL